MRALIVVPTLALIFAAVLAPETSTAGTVIASASERERERIYHHDLIKSLAVNRFAPQVHDELLAVPVRWEYRATLPDGTFVGGYYMPGDGYIVVSDRNEEIGLQAAVDVLEHEYAHALYDRHYGGRDVSIGGLTPYGAALASVDPAAHPRFFAFVVARGLTGDPGHIFTAIITEFRYVEDLPSVLAEHLRPVLLARWPVRYF